MSFSRLNRLYLLAALAATALLAGAATSATASAAGPAWAVDFSHSPTNVTVGRKVNLMVLPTNVGTSATSGTVTVKVNVSPELTVNSMAGTGWTCVVATTTCTSTTAVAAGSQSSTPTGLFFANGILVIATVNAGATGPLVDSVTISGGGAPACGGVSQPACAGATDSAVVGPPASSFGIESFYAKTFDSSGQEVTQAGGHPWLGITDIAFNTVYNGSGENVSTVSDLRTATVSLPPGFVGNAQSSPKCPIALHTISSQTSACPANSQVGRIVLTNYGGGTPSFATSPVYNLVPEKGKPAQFGFSVANVPQVVAAKLRSDGSYAIEVSAKNSAVNLVTTRALFTFWGEPGQLNGSGGTVPLLTNPTDCSAGPPVTSLYATNWLNSGAEDAHGNAILSDPNWKVAKSTAPALTGCDQLAFNPSIAVTPSTTQAETPAGYRFHIGVPQTNDFSTLATPALRNSKVILPAGVALTPAAADGLAGCTDAQIGLHSLDPATCPDASKVGTVHVATPLLASQATDFLPEGAGGIHYQLTGSVYVRQPDAGADRSSRFSVFLDIEDPATGIVVKLRGNVVPDPVTGQLTATFTENPPLPFSDLLLEFRSGPRAPLVNPVGCGSYTTTTALTPWSSNPDATPSSSFEVDAGAGGSACPAGGARPFGPGLEAGTDVAKAGAASPFTLKLTRKDGEQDLTSIKTTTPPGFAAVLKGVGSCSDAAIAAAAANPSGVAEQKTPSCPASSQVGTITTGAGAGPSPYYVGGKAYLAGPYKGAPLSLVFITPAVAGPFDLGNVVVRAGVYVDPTTAQVTVMSDPIPQILEGVPLRVRSVAVHVDRPKFTINPTSCEKLSVGATVSGSNGAVSNLSNPFQVGGCDALGFKPKLDLSLKGGTKRNRYPALTATLTQPEGQANIRSVSVALPHSEFLAQNHINTVCTRVQFAAQACPAGSIYGFAEAISPLLDQPLVGPVYLRSSEHKLPDLVATLKGPASQPIEVDLEGRIDSFKGGIRNSFELVPDAPVSKFTLRMKGGSKGLLVNSRDLCGRSAQATARIIGQNNKRADQFPTLRNDCGKKHKG